jgi:hypothetical protein
MNPNKIRTAVGLVGGGLVASALLTSAPAHADMISVVGDDSYGAGVDYSGISGTEITRVIPGEVVA